MQLDPELEPHLVEAARLNNLDPNLIRALLAGESSSNPNTHPSSKGAIGIAQFMPETAARMGIDPSDPVQGIYGAARLLNDNLTQAEQIRAGGRNINPTDYALRMYFAGDEGPQWKEETAAYPGYIYGRYRQLSGGAQPVTAGSKNGGAMTPLDQLSASGQPPAQGDADSGVMQLAQLSAPNEAAIWQGFIKGDYDHLFKPPTAPSAQPQPQAAPQSAPSTGGQPVLGPEQIINLLNTAGQAKGGLAAVPGLISGLETMLKAGTQFARQPDGSIGIGTIGGAPESAQKMKAAEAAGGKLQTIAPNGQVSNMPGAVESAAQSAGGVKAAESVGEFPAKAALSDVDANNRIRAKLAEEGMEIKNGVIVPIQNFNEAKAGQTGAVKGAEGMSAAGTKALDDAHQAELAANRRTQVYGQMAEAMRGFDPGATSETQLRADRIFKDLFNVGFFNGTEKVPPAEIFQQAAKHLQITAQPKGQGAVSNFERELFSQAVPAMVNSPEALNKAIEIGKRLDDYDRQVAQIHRDVAKQNGGLPNYIEAQQRIATLGPPLSPGETAALERLKPGQNAAGGAKPDPAAVEAEMRRRGLLK